MKKEEIIDKAEEFVKCLYYPVARSKKEAVQLIIDFYDSLTELSGQEERSVEEMLNKYAKEHPRKYESFVALIENESAVDVYDIVLKFASQFQQEDKISDERFKMPTDKQLIEIMILFNKGKLQKNKLADMLSPCLLILDRLYENGDVTIPTKKENKD